MRYLIIFNNKAFYTEWYQYENYQEGMIVIDSHVGMISFNGIDWVLIEFDEL